MNLAQHKGIPQRAFVLYPVYLIQIKLCLLMHEPGCDRQKLFGIREFATVMEFEFHAILS